MASKKVLLIDDDKAIHELVRTALSKHPYQVHSAFDPLQGLAMARKDPPDLVILDISMPAGGGVEFFQRLRNLGNTAHIPVVVVSSHSKAEVSKLINDPNLRIVTKPFQPADLVAALEGKALTDPAVART